MVVIMGKVSMHNRSKIITLYQEGYSERQIAVKAKASKTAVHSILKKIQETGSVEDKKRTGRPRKIKEADVRYLKLQSLRDRFKTSTQLAVDLQRTTGTNISPSCVRKLLIKEDLPGRVAARKPLFRRGNIKKRLEYAKEHKDWSLEMWNRVLFTDES